MRFGLPISLACHVALVAWALISISATRQLREPEVALIDAEFIIPADKTDLRQGSSKAKPEPAKAEKKDAVKPVVEEEKKKRVATLAPAKAEEATKKDEPKKEEPKKDDPIAKVIEKELEKDKEKKEEPKKEAKKEKKDEPKKAKSKDKFDPDKVAALLNKLPDAASSDKAVADDPAAKKVTKKSQLGVENGSGQKLTVSEEEMLKALFDRQVKRCWSQLATAAGTDQMIVRLTIRLRQSGEVDGIPRVRGGGSEDFQQIAAENAVRAVLECQPYELPAELYERGWKSIDWEFGPEIQVNG